MKVLFVHQNFPGQYRYLAHALAAAKCEVAALGDVDNVSQNFRIPGVRLFGYRCADSTAAHVHPYVRPLEQSTRRGAAVAAACEKLRAEGFTPEVIYAHPGWGEALFLRDVFPAARLVLYCEFYYRARGADVGFDPEYPGAPDDAYRLRIKNAAALLSLEASDAGTSPTNWQRDSFPGEFKARIRVVHDGIDTDFFAPGGADALDLPHGGESLTRADEVVTYVARNLEPYRGFHSFMRAVPIIQAQRPHAHIVVAGHDGVSYGTALPEGETYKSRLLSEVGACVDMTRLHFIDWLPYGALRTLYRISAAHVYLTYPFVLSWSLLEAMSTGCPIVASDTEPVREIVRDGQNGRLVDFFNPQAIADAVERSLSDRSDATPMRLDARATIVERYDLRRVCLPAQMAEFKL